MNTLPTPKPHPRLFLPSGGFDALRHQVRSDAPSRRIADCLRRKAAQFCTLPVSQRVLQGRRLLDVSRTCLQRVLTLAMAAQLDGEKSFVRRAADEMLAVASFTDWNPGHFLDVAEMTFALGTGYDWLYDLLSADERERIAAAILEKGINPSLDEDHSSCWWIKTGNNWNQVCHAGMVVGALAIAEHEPALAARIIERAVANVPVAAKEYAPDGAYAEGPMYWGYGTSFHVALLSALESATGDEHGLADGPGFLASAHYICEMAGPNEKYFNYSDCREYASVEPQLLWFAQRLGEPALASQVLSRLDASLSHYELKADGGDHRLLALALAWHRPLAEGAASGKRDLSLPLSWRGRGTTPVAVHRSSWDDAQATFVGIKGGSASASHAHMDAGSFVLDAGGVRWASDLGMQEYNGLEQQGIGLWDGKQEGGRWTIFRLGSQGHNVLSFNGAHQLVSGHAPIVRFGAGERGAMAHTVVDLDTTYADHVSHAWRGAGLLADGRVLLQDEWTAGSLAVEVRWQLDTFADVTVDEARGCFLLAHGGKRLELRIDPYPGAPAIKMSVEDKAQPANTWDVPNPKLKQIIVRLHTEAGQSGALRLIAALEEVVARALPPRQSLAEWSEGL